MSKWGKDNIKLPKIYEPEPDYVIPEPKALTKDLNEKIKISIISLFILGLFI